MSSFTEPLYLTPSADGATWVTTRGFSYEIGRLGSDLLIPVPAGTVTDLGTIPWWCGWLASPADPKMAAAFVLHDMLCRDLAFSRTMADVILYEALRVLGVGRTRAALMFLGVRLYAQL